MTDLTGWILDLLILVFLLIAIPAILLCFGWLGEQLSPSRGWRRGVFVGVALILLSLAITVVAWEV